MKNIRIGLVGAGYWGKNLVRAMNEIGALKKVCDSSEKTRAELSEKYKNVEFTADFSDLLGQDIDAIVISSPASAHFSQAIEALKAGKDVFVEKPLALNPEDGAKLVAAASANNRILFVGHILNYHPAIIKMKNVVDEGTIGRIQYVYSNRLNLGKIRREENILWSFAPHDISIILSLIGEEPSLIECAGSNFLHSEIADITMTNLKFPSGTAAHIFVSWLNPFKEQRLVVVGSKGMLVFDDTKQVDEKLLFYPHTIEWKSGLPVPNKADAAAIELSESWTEPLKAECEAFIKSVETRVPACTSGEEGLKVLKILQACQDKLGKKNPREQSELSDARQKDFFCHSSSFVDEGAKIGKGTKIWHFSHVLRGAEIGGKCILGQNVCVSENVIIGNNVKIQNNISIYAGTVIEDDVFLGPSCVLTNVTNPRSQINRHSLYEKTIFKRGATVGANATIVCGITLGRYCFVAAGAVVAKDVPDYALMVGVPARQKGWMSRHGHILSNPDKDGIMTCPESGYKYKETKNGDLKCLDIDEEAALPDDKKIGKICYDKLKNKENKKQ
jgi:UDP-2-acetamido-3-amino-2,3-dideoxy-glucuronate N-acetyltransferase